VSRRGWTRTSSLLFVRQALCAIELLAEKWAELESNQRSPAYQTGALPLSYPPKAPGQGVRTSVQPSPDSGEAPLQYLGGHGLSSLAAETEDGERVGRATSLRPAPARGGRRRVVVSYVTAGFRPTDVFQATRLPFDPGSAGAGCAFAAAVVLRGGALEPDPGSSSVVCAGLRQP
jgi:hypothetical protein